MDVRPLFHPSVEDITVEGILHALSDPVRAAIYVGIVAQECSHNCSTLTTSVTRQFRSPRYRNTSGR